MKVGVNVAVFEDGKVLLTKRNDFDEVLEMAYFAANEIPENLLWGHPQRIQDALSGIGGGVAWFQNVPFDPVKNRQKLYDLSEKSGLSGRDFYEQNFGWDTPHNDYLEVG